MRSIKTTEAVNASESILPSAMVMWRLFTIGSFELGAKPPHAERTGDSFSNSNQHQLFFLFLNVPVSKLFHFDFAGLCPYPCCAQVELLQVEKKKKKMENQV